MTKDEKQEKTEKNYVLSGQNVIDYLKTMYCPDQYVEKIRNNDDWHKFYKRTDIFKAQTSEMQIQIKEDNILLLILESPHTDEFDTNGKPIGPANGPTGDNIRKYIAKIFPDYMNYHLILMNAIPFQCSLGYSLSENTNITRRNEVFATAWEDENIGSIFFETRLEKLLDNLLKNDKDPKVENIVIVNACTGATGNTKEPLCCKVCKSTIDVISNNHKYPVKFYHLHHPSTWNAPNRSRQNKPNKQNKNKYEFFWETDQKAVSSTNEEEMNFDCEKEKWWTNYLNTENLQKCCYGKLKVKHTVKKQ